MYFNYYEGNQWVVYWVFWSAEDMHSGAIFSSIWDENGTQNGGNLKGKISFHLFPSWPIKEPNDNHRFLIMFLRLFGLSHEEGGWLIGRWIITCRIDYNYNRWRLVGYTPSLECAYIVIDITHIRIIRPGLGLFWDQVESVSWNVLFFTYLLYKKNTSPCFQKYSIGVSVAKMKMLLTT